VTLNALSFVPLGEATKGGIQDVGNAIHQIHDVYQRNNVLGFQKGKKSTQKKGIFGSIRGYF